MQLAQRKKLGLEAFTTLKETMSQAFVYLHRPLVCNVHCRAASMQV